MVWRSDVNGSFKWCGMGDRGSQCHGCLLGARANQNELVIVLAKKAEELASQERQQKVKLVTYLRLLGINPDEI